MPELSIGTDAAQLLIRGASGAEVARTTIAADGAAFTWDGTGTDGATLPYGAYRFDIVRYREGAAFSEAPAEVFSRVAEVQSIDGATHIVLQGGTLVATSEVSALRSPELS